MSEWITEKMGNVANFLNGRAYKATEFKEFGTPIIRIQNLTGVGNYVYSDLELEENKYIDKNDLIYAWSATFGPYIWKGPKSIYHYHIWKVIPNYELISKQFLYQFLNYDIDKIKEDQGTGATMMHVGKGSMDARIIPLPPLQEQQRIVAILDEAFAAIAQAKANAEQNLQNAKELFESYLQGVFENKGDGWEKKALGDVVDNIMTGPFGSMLHKSDYVENGIPVVNPQNIVNGQIISIQKTMVNTGTFNRLEKYALKKGDIVVARRGEMGRCAIVQNDNVGWICGTGSFVIRVNDKKTNSNFLNIILSSSEVKKQLENSSIGATMSNLNQSILSELLINLPSLTEQALIVQKLDSLSTETKQLEVIYQQKINDMDELKKSILQKAFAGELNTAVDIT
jgi:type I restriction enzyme S subunit